MRGAAMPSLNPYSHGPGGTYCSAPRHLWQASALLPSPGWPAAATAPLSPPAISMRIRQRSAVAAETESCRELALYGMVRPIQDTSDSTGDVYAYQVLLETGTMALD